MALASGQKAVAQDVLDAIAAAVANLVAVSPQTITVTLADPTAATTTATIKTTGSLATVYRAMWNGSTPYAGAYASNPITMMLDSLGNGSATTAVTWTAPGDYLQVVGNSATYLPVGKSPLYTPTTTVAPIIGGSTSTQPNFVWRAGMKACFDLERSFAETPSLWQQTLASCTANNNAMGITHVGITIPYDPLQDYLYTLGGTAPTVANPVQPFSSGRITRYLNCAAAFIAAGIRVRLNCCDQTEVSEATNCAGLLQAQITNVCAAISARATTDLPTGKLAVGCFSEMQGGQQTSNATWQGFMNSFWPFMANLLPANTPLSMGSGYWDYWATQSVAAGYGVPPSLKPVIVVEMHLYDSTMTLGYFQGIATKMDATEAATGCPVFVGETCAWNVNFQTSPYSATNYAAGIAIYQQAYINHGFMLWSVSTQSGSGPLNVPGTGTIQPAMVTALTAANQAMPGAPAGPGGTGTVVETISLAAIASVATGATVSASLVFGNLAASYTPAPVYTLDGNPVTPATSSTTASSATSQTLALTFTGIGNGSHVLAVHDGSNAVAATASQSFVVGTQTIHVTLDSISTATANATITTTGGLAVVYDAIFNGSTAYGPFSSGISLTMDANGNGTATLPVTWHSTGDYLNVVGSVTSFTPVGKSQSYAPSASGGATTGSGSVTLSIPVTTYIPSGASNGHVTASLYAPGWAGLTLYAALFNGATAYAAGTGLALDSYGCGHFETRCYATTGDYLQILNSASGGSSVASGGQMTKTAAPTSGVLEILTAYFTAAPAVGSAISIGGTFTGNMSNLNYRIGSTGGWVTMPQILIDNTGLTFTATIPATATGWNATGGQTITLQDQTNPTVTYLLGFGGALT